MADISAEYEVDPHFADGVKNEFIGIYKEICNKLSDNVFSDYLELLKNDDVIVKADTAIIVFKTFLLDELTNSFDRMWQSKEISQSLEFMELLKKKFEDRTDPQWRPYGLSATQQTIPLRVKVLEKREKYLEDMLEKQKNQIESMVSQIEKNRKLFEEHLIRRNMLVDQMDLRLTKLESAKAEVAQHLVAAVDKL